MTSRLTCCRMMSSLSRIYFFTWKKMSPEICSPEGSEGELLLFDMLLMVCRTFLFNSLNLNLLRIL